jgi:Cof subfamily protein (haloacid dehalogenase superfamily)
MNLTDATHVDKLIAIDLDGTLIVGEDAISDENIAAIHRAGRHGAAVIIVTGRPYVSADAVASRVGLPPVPLVGFNGAMIRWSRGGAPLTNTCLAAEVAEEIVNQCLLQGLHLQYYLDDQMYVSQDNERVRRYCQRNGMQYIEEPDLRRFAGQQPLKLLVIDHPTRIGQLLNDARQCWDDRIYVTRSMPEYLEFLSPQVSKGLALDWLLDFFDLPRERSLAIGDAMNDLPLLQHAGVPVAMPHADQDLKRIAHFVPASIENGVAEAIDWFLAQL